jgi:hypothetical protein
MFREYVDNHDKNPLQSDLPPRKMLKYVCTQDTLEMQHRPKPAQKVFTSSLRLIPPPRVAAQDKNQFYVQVYFYL